MSKVYALITTVFPIIFALGAIQLVLVFVKPETRNKVNFFLIGVLAFASIRPNILGESFGIIGPLYFVILVKLSKLIPSEFVPDRLSVEKARNALFFMLSINVLYWTYTALISSVKGYSYSFWPPIANMGTVGIDCYLIFQIFKLGKLNRLFKVFIYFIAFQSASAIISTYIFDGQFCFNFSAGRGWVYSICAPGVIYSSGDRLTGFGGEPSVFATYLSLAIVATWWLQFNLRIWSTVLISGTCAWASLISNSTTGVTLVFFALALVIFQRFQINQGPLLIMVYSSLVYYFINTGIIKNALSNILIEKQETNFGSIVDRSLNLSFADYLNRWQSHPFGDRWGIRGTFHSASINLLAESMLYGPLVIFLMISLILGAVFFSHNRVRTLSATFVIFTTCLFLQPTWLNAVWIILIYLITLANIGNDSDPSRDKDRMRLQLTNYHRQRPTD